MATSTEEMITSLPTVATAAMTDIIYAVQGFVSSPSALGLSVQETLQQVYNLFQSNIILFNAGNPNGSLAGTTYQFCWDTTDSILFICTTTGNAATAVWTQIANKTSAISWAPTFTFGTPGDLSVSYASQVGYYTRVGNLVNYYFGLVCTPTFTTSSGSMYVANLPVTVALANIVNSIALASAGFTYPSGVTSPICQPIAATNTILISGQGSTTIQMPFVPSNIVSGTAITLTGSGFYFS